MKQVYAVAVLAALVMTAACQDKPPARTVFDPLIQAPDKARAVEAKLQERAAQGVVAADHTEGGNAR
jgi:hypothetical protein